MEVSGRLYNSSRFKPKEIETQVSMNRLLGGPQNESEHFGEHKISCFWKDNFQFLGAHARSLVTALTELFRSLWIRLAFSVSEELLAVCVKSAHREITESTAKYISNKQTCCTCLLNVLYILVVNCLAILSYGIFSHY